MSANPHAVIVVAGGDDVPPSIASDLPAGAPVIAADSGVDHALALGLAVDVAVGDFDSVSAAGLEQVAAAGARITRHPAAKDATDLELALDEAMALQPVEIVVVGGHGGRLDHLLANSLLLASARYAAARVTARWGAATVHVLHGGDVVDVHAEPGALLSLLPAHGPALGVRTDGLRYPLHREDLPAGTTRGVSNVVERTRARIRLEQGTLLVVLPGVMDEGAI